MLISTRYDYGQILYLKTDPEQHPRIVTEISLVNKPIVDADGFTECRYGLSFGSAFQMHHEVEITTEVNIAIKLEFKEKE